MSLNVFLIQLVLITCVMMLIRGNHLPRGWFVIACLVLATLLLSFVTLPEWAGFISGSLWAVLILLPILGFSRVNQLVTQERYRQAWKLANLLKWLHPVDGYLDYPQLLKGLELAQQNRFEEAKQLITPHQSRMTLTGRNATAMLFRMNADWDGLRQWIESGVPEQNLVREPWLWLIYLRSLGEIGDLNHLLQGIEQFERRLGRNSNPVLLGTGRLYAMSFCGQVEQVQRLFEQALQRHPNQVRQFWIATAELITGRKAIAREMFADLQKTADRSLQQAIDWRLAAPPIDPLVVLTEPSRRILIDMKTAIAQDSRYNSWTALSARKSYATYGLIAINLAVFGLSTVLGGSNDLEVLYQLGALVPEAVFAGEWWRSLTAIFLHAGPLHIAANMLGLFVFGTVVESALGYKKFLGCYFFCGIGSMMAVAIISVLAQSEPQITVGASGAVLGMVGTEAAIQLKGWRFEKAKIARERLRLIGLVIGLQLISDLVTPQVSIIGHLSGVILGFLAGLVLFGPEQSGM